MQDKRTEAAIAAHYSLGGLRERIQAGLARLDAPPSVENLGPVDEFHLGGRPATAHLIAQLELTAADHVIDLGSGLGGTARLIAASTGATVTGVDLSPEYVEVATWLSQLVGLSELVGFRNESALAIGAPDHAFTAATMVHVGMNIADKPSLSREVARVLQPGSLFAIYDIVATSPDAANEIGYPTPWASAATSSALAEADTYRSSLDGAGFELLAVNDRSEAALDGLGQVARAAASGPPALGLHLVMGPETAIKVANMRAALEAGLIAPTEFVARRRQRSAG